MPSSIGASSGAAARRRGHGYWYDWGQARRPRSCKDWGTTVGLAQRRSDLRPCQGTPRRRFDADEMTEQPPLARQRTAARRLLCRACRTDLLDVDHGECRQACSCSFNVGRGEPRLVGGTPAPRDGCSRSRSRVASPIRPRSTLRRRRPRRGVPLRADRVSPRSATRFPRVVSGFGKRFHAARLWQAHRTPLVARLRSPRGIAPVRTDSVPFRGAVH